MDYSGYERYFVMLDEQSEDFAMRQAARCGGHIKIEIAEGKGAMRIGVRNLKPFEKGEYTYKLIFFGTSHEKTIYAIIGTVNVSRIGGGETYFRFDPSHMDRNGHELYEFSHAIVAAVSNTDENEPLHPVMKGNLDFPIFDKDEKREDYDEAEIETVSSRTCFNEYYNRYILAHCHKEAGNLNVYDRVMPFKEDVTCAEWTKMNPETPIPIVSPGAEMLSMKYRHYIFGVGDGLYYFGVPGRFLREEQPEEGESGFTLWQPIIGAEDLGATAEDATEEVRRQAYGYWIIAIDMENGDILEA